MQAITARLEPFFCGSHLTDGEGFLMTHVRDHRSILASVEKRMLIFIAQRLPRAVNSDHLTALALMAMAVAGGAFAVARWDVRALWVVVLGLVLNWFGDSLDGTLARVRRAERPRYGFYVDHVVDIVGATLLLGGLACSPFMSPIIALGVLVAYLLVSGEVFLATAVKGVFKVSVAGIGPTELRIVLAVGTLALLRSPHVRIGALTVGLFDVGGAVAAAALFIVFIVSALRNGAALAVAERR
jgi:phosphatidylglycerophosphate synthase